MGIYSADYGLPINTLKTLGIDKRKGLPKKNFPVAERVIIPTTSL
jgi:hypothetical protein